MDGGSSQAGRMGDGNGMDDAPVGREDMQRTRGTWYRRGNGCMTCSVAFSLQMRGDPMTSRLSRRGMDGREGCTV